MGREGKQRFEVHKRLAYNITVSLMVYTPMVHVYGVGKGRRTKKGPASLLMPTDSVSPVTR